MKSFPAIIALALVATAAASPVFDIDEQKLEGRIVGGEDADILDHPYQVSVQLKGHHYCGGIILSPNLILTAAHCALKPLPSYTVRSGSSLSDEGGSVHTVKKIVKHPKYALSRFGVPFHDIAVFELNEPIEFSDTQQPIDLYKEDEESYAGDMALITGWGRTKEGATRVLQKITLPIVSKERCDRAYKPMGGLPIGQICAAIPEGGKDSCGGDSGGPLVIENRLAGVVSWGKNCGLPGYPGVYTEVASYRSWIRKVTKL